MPRRRRWFLVLGVGLLLLAGGGVAYLARQTHPGVSRGQSLPLARLLDLEGAPLDLEPLQGKLVLLDFWAST